MSERWATEVLGNDRFITTYDAVYKENLCENIVNEDTDDESVHHFSRMIHKVMDALGWSFLYVLIIAVAATLLMIVHYQMCINRRGEYEVIEWIIEKENKQF